MLTLELVRRKRLISRMLERECNGVGLWMIEVVDDTDEEQKRLKEDLIYSISNIDGHPIPT